MHKLTKYALYMILYIDSNFKFVFTKMMGDFFMKRFFAAFLLLFLYAGVALASVPFDVSKTANREQVFNNIADAAHGCFFFERGADHNPFMPKGFPNWGDLESKVHKILGEPHFKAELYGMSAESYGYFVVGYQNGELAFFCFDSFCEPERNYYMKIGGWNRVNPPEKNVFERSQDSDSHKIYKSHFTNYKHFRHYVIYTWRDNTENMYYSKDPNKWASYVGTKKAAIQAGMID